MMSELERKTMLGIVSAILQFNDLDERQFADLQIIRQGLASGIPLSEANKNRIREIVKSD